MDTVREKPAIRIYSVVGFVLGLALFVLFLLNPFGLPPKAAAVAGVASLMACFWISLCLPIPVTSLLPIVLFPALGILGSRETTKFYADDNIYLFLGGFIIALALEKWGFSKRIALHIARLAGSSSNGMVLGFFSATALLSMVISNTATAMMMLPIALAVISQTAELTGRKDSNLAFGLMLAVAYGASIGGIATPIGTPPNIVFLGQLKEAFPLAPPITFFEWGKVFVPLSIIFVVVAWLIVTRIVAPPKFKTTAGREVIAGELKKLGPMSRPEMKVGIVFILTILLWVFRQPIDLQLFTIPGWSSLFGSPAFLSDATVSVAMAILLFMIPAGASRSAERSADPGQAEEEDALEGEHRGFLMDWRTAIRVPWGILLLFGGGFAIAGGFKESGLDTILGLAIKPLLDIHPILVIALVCLLLTFLTELTSNTATTAALLPVMIGMANGLQLNPLMLMVPATISASFAFMLPVGTPPNAIVFSSGYVPLSRMAWTGLIMNFAGVVLVTVWMWFVVLPVWGQGVQAPVWVGP